MQAIVFKWFAFVLASCIQQRNSVQSAMARKEFLISGLFDEDDHLLQTAFTFAIQKFNNRSTSIQLIPHLQSLVGSDALQNLQQVCQMTLLRSVAVLSAADEPSRSQIASVCDRKEIPHLVAAGWDYSNSSYHYSISFYPPPDAVGRALVQLVRYLGWSSLVLLYQDERDLIQMQEILKLSGSQNGQRGIRIHIRQLPAAADLAPILKELQEMQIYRFIVHADLVLVHKFLEQSLQLGMFTEYYHYIFANLDIWTLDLEPYKAEFLTCNFTGIRLVQKNSDTAHLIDELKKHSPHSFSMLGIQTSVAVVYDSIRFIGHALQKLADILQPEQLSCQSQLSWTNGATLINHLKTMELSSSSGRIRFDSYGHRSDFELNFIELTAAGFEEMGKWRSRDNQLVITNNLTRSANEQAKRLQNKTLIISVYIEVPFVMLKENHEKLEGNEKYEGYCIDLLHEIARLVKFNFTIKEVQDKQYGSKDIATNRWNGMVGELYRGEADLAVASLTITSSRSEVIDFSVPFMHLGISILFLRPKKEDPGLFSFLSPLALDVWIYMLAAYIGVSLTLWILARFSPYEWYNPHPCKPNADVVENQFSLLNSLWFTVGSLMQQGCDIAPRATSTRLVAGIWWFFTLILISSYTANLAAFLTVERLVSPIESADDLTKQTKIKYGTLSSGSTMTFFRDSKIQTYEKMWSFMETAQPSVFVNSSIEGIEWVRKGDYAYLMESSMLEYNIERNCDLMQINGLLDSKGYGIGMPRGSPLRESISSAILRLQENTNLTAMKQLWWKHKLDGGRCDDVDSSKQRKNELVLANLGGVFVLLLCGLALGMLIAIIEFAVQTRRDAELKQIPLCVAMWQEFKRASLCRSNKRDARKRVSSNAFEID